MSEQKKGARVLLGGEASCSAFSKAELAVLEDILSARVSVRSMIVHSALRIVCQAVLENPDGGYPGSLYELKELTRHGGSGSLDRSQRQPEPDIPSDSSPSAGGSDEWLTGKAASRSEGVTVEDALSVSTSTQEDVRPASNAEPDQTDDPARAEMRSMARSFIG